MQERTRLSLLGTTVALVSAIGCSSTSRELVGPQATGGITNSTTANHAEGTTLKASAPVNMSPPHQETLDTLTPTLEIQNASGFFFNVPFTYLFELYEGNVLVNTFRVPQGAGGRTSLAMPDELKFSTLYRWRARAEFEEAIGAFSRTTDFTTPAPPRPPARRTPDPAPGQRLPLPNMFHIVQEVAGQYPGALRNSCQDHGGTWEFLDNLVDRLRQFDTRWGYNWKRGRVGDPSLDVVDYHWGPGEDEGSIEVYIIDVIAGHCGNSPSPIWNDVTDITYNSGTVGMWTGRGRF